LAAHLFNSNGSTIFNGIFTLTVAAGNQNRLNHSRIMDEREHKVVMHKNDVHRGQTGAINLMARELVDAMEQFLDERNLMINEF
jgi:hypothetical protein